MIANLQNLYKKLVENRDSLLVVDWFKDINTTLNLKREVYYEMCARNIPKHS